MKPKKAFAKNIILLDLFNKIAKNEPVPQKIYFHDEEFEYIDGDYYSDGGWCFSTYMGEDTLKYELNDEVGIIEDDEIKPLPILGNYEIRSGDNFMDRVLTNINQRINEVISKQNEIIEVLNELTQEEIDEE